MYMNISDFRNNLKVCFDNALKAPVEVERGGIVFELRATGVRSSVISVPVDIERDGYVPTNTPPSKPIHKVPAIPGLMTAAQLEEPECPRHHVAKSLCVGRH